MKSMMKYLAAAGLAALCLTGCGRPVPADLSSPSAGDRLVDNIKVENYYETGTNREYIRSVPQRVIVVGANETELLLDLGAGESILAVADGQNSPVFGIKTQNRPAFDAFPKLARTEMVSEHILDLHPDLIVAQQEFFSKNRLGSTDYWNSKGIYTMVPLNTTSPGKLNQAETVEKEMKFIRDMGVIFHQEDRAGRIIRDTEARIREVREAVKEKPAPTVMIVDRMSILASYGRKKIAGDMASSIGAHVPDTPAAVSDELMMKLDPDVVFMVVYRDEKELDWLRNKPAYRNLKFIKNHRLYGIPLKYVYGPQTRTIDAIGYMAERIYPGQFDFPKEYVVPEE